METINLLILVLMIVIVCCLMGLFFMVQKFMNEIADSIDDVNAKVESMAEQMVDVRHELCGGDADMISRQIVLNKKVHSILVILAKKFHMPEVFRYQEAKQNAEENRQ